MIPGAVNCCLPHRYRAFAFPDEGYEVCHFTGGQDDKRASEEGGSVMTSRSGFCVRGCHHLQSREVRRRCTTSDIMHRGLPTKTFLVPTSPATTSSTMDAIRVGRRFVERKCSDPRRRSLVSEERRTLLK
jgi:hypothetical protein